mgnify:CR=1 FL=1
MPLGVLLLSPTRPVGQLPSREGGSAWPKGGTQKNRKPSAPVSFQNGEAGDPAT